MYYIVCICRPTLNKLIFHDRRFAISIHLTIHNSLLQSLETTEAIPTTPGNPIIKTAQHPIISRPFRRNTAARNTPKHTGSWQHYKFS